MPMVMLYQESMLCKQEVTATCNHRSHSTTNDKLRRPCTSIPPFACPDTALPLIGVGAELTVELSLAEKACDWK